MLFTTILPVIGVVGILLLIIACGGYCIYRRYANNKKNTDPEEQDTTQDFTARKDEEKVTKKHNKHYQSTKNIDEEQDINKTKLKKEETTSNQELQVTKNPILQELIRNCSQLKTTYSTKVPAKILLVERQGERGAPNGHVEEDNDHYDVSYLTEIGAGAGNVTDMSEVLGGAKEHSDSVDA